METSRPWALPRPTAPRSHLQCGGHVLGERGAAAAPAPVAENVPATCPPSLPSAQRPSRATILSHQPHRLLPFPTRMSDKPSPGTAVNFGLNLAAAYAEKPITASYLRVYNIVRGSPQERALHDVYRSRLCRLPGRGAKGRPAGGSGRHRRRMRPLLQGYLTSPILAGGRPGGGMPARLARWKRVSWNPAPPSASSISASTCAAGWTPSSRPHPRAAGRAGELAAPCQPGIVAPAIISNSHIAHVLNLYTQQQRSAPTAPAGR